MTRLLPEPLASYQTPHADDGDLAALAVCRACGFQLAAIYRHAPPTIDAISMFLWPGAVASGDKPHGLPGYVRTKRAKARSGHGPSPARLFDRLPATDRTRVWVTCPSDKCGTGQEINAARILREAASTV